MFNFDHILKDSIKENIRENIKEKIKRYNVTQKHLTLIKFQTKT